MPSLIEAADNAFVDALAFKKNSKDDKEHIAHESEKSIAEITNYVKHALESGIAPGEKLDASYKVCAKRYYEKYYLKSELKLLFCLLIASSVTLFVPDFIIILAIFAVMFYILVSVNVYLYINTSIKHEPKSIQEIVKNLVFGGNTKFWPIIFWIITPVLFLVYRVLDKKIQIFDISNYRLITNLFLYITPNKSFLSVAPEFNFVFILALFCIFVGAINLFYEKYFAFKTIDITSEIQTQGSFSNTNNQENQQATPIPKPKYRGLD